MNQAPSQPTVDVVLRFAKMPVDLGRYEGQVFNNIPHGRGTIIFKNGAISGWKYRGDFDMGVMQGEANLLDEKTTLRYTGGYSNGKKAGFGKEFAKNGVIKYEGEWVNG